MKPTRLLLVMAVLGAFAQHASAQGGKSGVERLYVMNCGEGVAGDISRWSPGVNVGKSMDFVDNCYLIKHSQGWLLWDTGLADAIAAMPNGQAPSDPRMTHWRRPKTLASQLEQIGVKPSDIKYVAVSHTHPDHIGNVEMFPQTMLLVQKTEYEWPNPLGVGRFKPEHPVTKLEGDHDVFGDGNVVVIATPGHTPGHQSLLVKLPKTGAVLLSGDAVHFKENWEIGACQKNNDNKDKRRLYAAYSRRHGQGKGAALDQSRQGPARHPETVARITTSEETNASACWSLHAPWFASRIGDRRGTGADRLSEPADHHGRAAAGRRHRRSLVPVRGREGERRARPAGGDRESSGRRRRTGRNRGGAACSARRLHIIMRSAADLQHHPSRLCQGGVRHPRDGADQRARDLPVDPDRRPDLAANSLPELLAYARANPARSITDTRARAIPDISSASCSCSRANSA